MYASYHFSFPQNKNLFHSDHCIIVFLGSPNSKYNLSLINFYSGKLIFILQNNAENIYAYWGSSLYSEVFFQCQAIQKHVD